MKNNCKARRTAKSAANAPDRARAPSPERYRAWLLMLSASTSMSAAWAAQAPTPVPVDGEGGAANWLAGQVRLFRAYPHLDRAYKLIADGRFNEAAIELRAYLGIESGDKNTRVTYLNILYRLKRYDDVLKQADELLRLDSGNAQARLFRGLVLQARSQDDAALAVMLPLLRSAAADGPTRNAAAAAAVDLAMRLGRYNDALQALSTLNDRSNAFAYRMQEGAALAGLGRYGPASAAYLQALGAAVTPAEKRQAHQTLFYLAHKHNDSATALIHAQAIVSATPTDGTWVRALAMTYYLLKDEGHALSTLASLGPSAMTSDDHFFEANLRLARNEFTEAATAFSKVAQESTTAPRKFRAYMGLGYAFAGMRQMRQAAQAFSQAHAIDAGDESTRALDTVSRMLSAKNGDNPRVTDGIMRANFSSGASLSAAQVLPPAARAGSDADGAARQHRSARAQAATGSATGTAAVSVSVSASASASGAPAAATDGAAALSEKQQALMQQGYDAVAQHDDTAAASAFQSAINEGVDTAQVYLDLGFAYLRLQHAAQARDSFVRALERDRTPTHLLYVARSYEATGQVEMAVQYLQIIKGELQGLAPTEQKAVLIEMGNLYAKQKIFDVAESSFAQALAIAIDPTTLLSLAYVQEAAGHDSDALATLARIDLSTLPTDMRLQVATRLQRLYDKLGDVAMATGCLLDIVGADPSAANYYQLGVYESAHGHPEPGLAHLKKAFEIDPANPVYAEQLAYLYKNRGALADAAAMFEAAIARHPNDDRLYHDLAYTYKQLGDNTHAVEWFKRAIDARYAQVRAANQANHAKQASQAGQPAQAAQSTPANQGDRPDQTSQAKPAEAAITQPAPTADKSREQANAGEQPENHAATAQQSQAFADLARMGQASAAGADGGFQQVGFLLPRQTRAPEWDRPGPMNDQTANADTDVDADADTTVRADAVAGTIDASPDRIAALSSLAPPPSEPDAGAADRTSITQGQDTDLYRMRQEVRDLSRRFQFNVYESYRSKAQPGGTASAQAGFFNTGAIPSQGGVELIYQPPNIGYQDGKIFQLFTRGLWSNQPDSLAIAHETLQAAVGARYKPFKTQDMFFSVERLIKIGDQAENDWLLRTSYAWSDGYELKPNQSSWNQTTVYSDLGYFFPKADIKALYAEVRQGRAFNFANQVVVTPHVMLAGRSQRPDPSNVSYREAGVGVAVKYLFNENRYEAERSSVDVWLQYRRSFTQQHVGGWVMTAALQF